MARKLKRSRMENDSREPSVDVMPPEETAPPKRCSQGRRNTGRKKGKTMQILVKFKDDMTSEMRKLNENHIESNKKLNNEISEMCKLLEKCTESNNNQSIMLEKCIESNNNQSILLEKCIESNNNQSIVFGELIEHLSCQGKHLEKVTETLEKVTERLEKLSEGQNDLHKQLEFHTNTPRSLQNQEQQPRYRLEFKSNMEEKIEKGKSIEIHVALVDYNSGQTVKNGPLASATVELVVIDAKFNQNNNRHNWSIEEFTSNINKAGPGNSATVNVDESGTSIVTNGRFNLENGDKHHCDFSIFRNSGNSRFRLGVMVVPAPPERVLEGLSNPFFVRGHDRNRTKARVGNGNQEQNGPMSNMQNPTRPNSTPADGNAQAQVGNGNQEQNGPMSNMQNPSYPNSIQADGNGWGITPTLEGQHLSPLQRTTVFSTEPATFQQHQVPHPSMMAQAWNNPIGVHDGCPEQNGPMPMHNPLWSNSTQGMDTIGQTQQLIGNPDITYTEPYASQVHQALVPQNQDHWWNFLPHQPMNSGTGMPFNTNRTAYPVRLIWDMPSVVPSKYCFNLLDQLMLPHSWQPKSCNCGLPTTRLMQEHFGSLTAMPKEVMHTRRERGVLIEPLEPDDSDEGQPLKRKLHSKYQLRFVNKVCETYYTGDQIKADEDNLLKVALFDENNMKITSGPLSSASVEVVALHGDFNCDGQDYWTSEEFNCSVVCPPPGEEASSVLGGDRILVLAGGEACISDAFFQRTSFCARTGKFKMGVMLASAQEERIQEGISEPFRVMDHRLAGACGRVFGKRPEEDSASINHTLAVRPSMWNLLSRVKAKASSCRLDQYNVMKGGMEKQQKNLERMLLEILDIIEDAEEKGAFHDVVAAWLNDLKKVAYKANAIFRESGNAIVLFKKLCKIVQAFEVLVTEMNALGIRHMEQAPPSKQLMKTEPILFDSDKDIVRRSRDKDATDRIADPTTKGKEVVGVRGRMSWSVAPAAALRRRGASRGKEDETGG